jgi:hypothetical protein
LRRIVLTAVRYGKSSFRTPRGWHAAGAQAETLGEMVLTTASDCWLGLPAETYDAKKTQATLFRSFPCCHFWLKESGNSQTSQR